MSVHFCLEVTGEETYRHCSTFNIITMYVVVHYTLPDIFRAFGSWSELLDVYVGVLVLLFLYHKIIDNYCVLFVKYISANHSMQQNIFQFKMVMIKV